MISLLLLWALRVESTGVANVSNVLPRRDSVTGEIIDIHDGTTIRIGDYFFWYGAGYGGCRLQPSGCANTTVGNCGFMLNHTVNLATSTNLVDWTFHGPVLAVADRPEGVLFSPWVARSNSTGMYVLWVNILPVNSQGRADFSKSRYAVATSESPLGPFKTAVGNVTGLAYTSLPDAASIFVDEDGQGYIAFTHESTHVNNVQQLTPDLLGPLPNGGTSAQIGPGNNEGILIFKRATKYFIMYGACCCFCGDGTNVDWYVSDSPLGPYTLGGTVLVSADWHGQTGAVWYTGVDYVLYGDRYQSAPDGIKGHDFAYMTPLAFDASGNPVSQQAAGFQNSVTIRY